MRRKFANLEWEACHHSRPCRLGEVVIASQAIYHLTPLALPSGTIKFINKIERAFLWSGKESTTGAKCKVNWDTVCRPKKLGGLGILHLGNFATALRLRWPWLQWKDPNRIWAGSGNPCTKEDMDFFLRCNRDHHWEWK